jgi:uncharacterized protein YfiM (DUF2279 family)
MKKILLALTVCAALSAEPFLEQADKQKHIVASMAISGAGTALARHYGSSPVEAFFIGVGSALLVGVAKEAIDGQGYGTEDVGDVYADTLGAVAGATLFNWRF